MSEPPASAVTQPIAPPPAKTNGWAIASLVCGLLACIPFVTGLLATIFGILGVKKSNPPQVGGRGLAIAGLVLGLLSLLAWTAGTAITGGAVFLIFQASAKPVAVAKGFANDLVSGDVDAALGRCAVGMKRSDIEHATDVLRQFGDLKDVSFASRSAQTTNGVTRWQLSGTATFAKTTKQYAITLQKDGDDYKIVRYSFD